MSLVGQVDWYFQVTVCARETCGIATVAVAAAPAAKAPDFSNFRREKDCASLLIGSPPLTAAFAAYFLSDRWYTTVLTEEGMPHQARISAAPSPAHGIGRAKTGRRAGHAGSCPALPGSSGQGHHFKGSSVPPSASSP